MGRISRMDPLGGLSRVHVNVFSAPHILEHKEIPSGIQSPVYAFAIHGHNGFGDGIPPGQGLGHLPVFLGNALGPVPGGLGKDPDPDGQALIAPGRGLVCLAP